jgi:hypothetical protein
MRGMLLHLVRYKSKQGGSPACKQQGYVDLVSGTFTEIALDKPELFGHKREYSCQTSFINQQEFLGPGNKSSVQHSRNRRAIKPSGNIDGSTAGVENIACIFIDVWNDLCAVLITISPFSINHSSKF